MSVLQDINSYMQKGRARQVTALVTQAKEEGIPARTILQEGLLDAMMVVGEKFKNNEVFVPEVLMAAKAMNAGIALIQDELKGEEAPFIGRVVLGTVQDDLHDIGKSLVALMMKGAGLEVVDLKVSVAPEQFVDAAVEHDADIIAMSALLTTTMPCMNRVIDLLNERGLRDRFIVMVGGAPVTQAFADEIGADIYTEDAASAAQAARAAIEAKRNG